VKKLAAEIWQNCDGTNVTSIRYGKGRVFCGVDLPTVFVAIGAAPDVTGLDRKSFPWIHRATTNGTDIYFISNQSDEPQSVSPGFHVTGCQPELWDAVTGEHRDLPEFICTNGDTIVPLQFAPRQSLFVVLQHPGKPPVTATKNFPVLTTVEKLDGPWTVQFDPKWGGPASVVFDSLMDWTQRPEGGIKYYSGTAKYQKTFELPTTTAGAKLFLDLGAVHDLVTVRLNGKNLGLVWCAPWRVDISGAVKPGVNELELDVINTWANRIIGDAKLPPAQRLTWTVLPHFTADSPLLPAGLIGPVTIQRE
jgi:hypothetical protein